VKKLAALLGAVALVASVAPAVLASSVVVPPSKTSNGTIVDVAVGNPNFSTLVAAVSCTGLVPALNGDDQLTVFAPTDAAFAKLGLDAGNICAALPSDALTSVLLYHVTDGRRFSNSVLPKSPSAKTIDTLLGQSFRVDRTGTIRTASGGTSSIVAANIAASNGVIHVIDSVLLPAS
jgi:uncharacterized surface protein with fasciclin (FAS1) repeats